MNHKFTIELLSSSESPLAKSESSDGKAVLAAASSGCAAFGDSSTSAMQAGSRRSFKAKQIGVRQRRMTEIHFNCMVAQVFSVLI